MAKRLILAVTNDEFELPVAIEESSVALVKKIGITASAISRQCRRETKHSRGDIKFLQIEVDE